MINKSRLPAGAANLPAFYCAFLVFSLAAFHLSSQPQQRKWFLNAKDVDFTVFPPAVAVTPNVNFENNSASNPQGAANGLISKNGLRKFNINGNRLCADVYPSPGLQKLPSLTAPNSIRPEISICPKPGSCDTFYFFYAHRVYQPGNNGCSSYQLKYYLVEPDKFNASNLNEGFIQEDIVLFNRSTGTDQYCPTPPALALSKEKVLGGG